ncbi:conserved hypothetical protein [Chloroherpeton thalassium ATCC 35110]|uniref:Metal-binding protein n=1 Tax=Chloroherpeton thalassium (strain ATCC 35110 / GB-78) TaxID=517418 RepID=B3QT22_CHLT3|nr:YecH family metal-binding protein [Chloroherpeton thalassium]ACF12665.1 conserved hypothetical protein [Chloroherpeton thalassium ATCC 35110]
MNNLHGHVILEKLIQSPRVYTRQKLQQEIEAKYGRDVVFYACGGENMSLSDLLQYLFNQGKIAEKDGLLTAFADKMCSHDH